jgi:hypothetical protein
VQPFYSTILVKFVQMKKTLKQISFLILALSINLVWANRSFEDIVFFQNHASTWTESSDSTDPFEYFHSICCEDDVFMVRNDLVPALKVDFLNDYLDNIWQPPKSC